MTKENTLFLLLILFVVYAPIQVFAQKPTIDNVTMKDGRVLKGKMLHYTPGKTLVFQPMEGEKMELADSDIAKIQQGMEIDAAAIEQFPNNKTNGLLTARTHGLYANSMLSFAAGGSDDEGLSLGAGFSEVIGYQLNEVMGVGVGFGIDNYSRRGETVYPIFAEVRGLLPSQKPSGNFYALAGGGYSLGFPRKSLDINDAEGGPMGYFAFGYRAATIEGVDIYVDLGAKFQEAHFIRTLYNGDVEVRNIDFRRIVIRVGVGFWK